MILYRSLTDRLQTQHESIQVIVANLSSDKMGWNPQPGKWSIKDNIAHLARYQPVFIDRLHKIMHSNNPLFEAYRAENDAEFPLWQSMDLQALFARLQSDRELIITMIREFSDTQLMRTGVHKKFGQLNTTEWAEFFLLHEAHHIFTIFQLAHSSE